LTGIAFRSDFLLAGAAFRSDFLLTGAAFFEGLAAGLGFTFLGAVGVGGLATKNGFLHFLQFV